MDVLTDPGAADPGLRRRLVVDLLIFGAATFALTWLIVGLYIWDNAAVTRAIGPMKLGAPAFYVAVYAPALAAIAVTVARHGRAGLASLFGSLVRIRVRWIWIAVSLLGYPLLWLAVGLVQVGAGGDLAQFDFRPWLVALPLLLLHGAILKDPGALGEELGWRGFALPRLLELTHARNASLLLGLVWAVWHVPAYFVGSLSQSALALAPFILQVMAFSVFMAWIFVNARGSVLWAGVVPHMLINATPHAGIHPVGWVFIVVAALILVFGGRHLRGPGRPRAVLPQSALLVGDRETP
jgi:membrane protease YdiL (CAAX protease family)